MDTGCVTHLEKLLGVSVVDDVGGCFAFASVVFFFFG